MFYVLWIIAESGRTVGPPWPAYPFTLAVLAASIGLARAFPGVAIMLPAAVLIFQLAFSPARFGSTTWPVYFGILIACFIVSATANKKTRLLALPVTAAYAVMCAMLMGIPTLSDGWGWSAWVGATYLVNPVQDSFLLLLAADLVLSARGHSLSGFDPHDYSRRRMRNLARPFKSYTRLRLTSSCLENAIGDSLKRIAGSARSSLSEVRILIESLVSEPEGHSNPTIENIDDLLERMRGAGLAVTEIVSVTPKHSLRASSLRCTGSFKRRSLTLSNTRAVSRLLASLLTGVVRA